MIIAVAIVLAVAAGTTLWTSKHTSVLPVSGKWETKRLPELGIQFSYPASWHLQDIDEMTGHARIVGTLISNLDHAFVHPNLGPSSSTSAFDMRGLDDALVVLSFQQLDRFNVEAKETSGLPLSLDRPAATIDSEPYGAPQPRYYLLFAVKGYLRSGVHVYVGDVNDAQRDAIERILASVKPL